MAFGDNLRILPVLGLALAGGLAIGLVAAFAQGGSVGVGAAQEAAGKDSSAPAAAEPRPVKWVVRERESPAEERIVRRDPPAMHSNTPRRRSSPTDVYYSGCREVRAAGAAPLYAGQPGYRPEMDGDSDGIACEPYRGR
jgi:hypothetical protein